MTQFVSIEDAKDHLRVDSDADDLWINLFISACSAAIISWLKDEWRCYVPVLDSNGDALEDSQGDTYPQLDINGNPIPKDQVKAAVLVELGQQYRFRDGSGAATMGAGYILGMGATSLLAGLRKSTVA